MLRLKSNTESGFVLEAKELMKIVCLFFMFRECCHECGGNKRIETENQYNKRLIFVFIRIIVVNLIRFSYLFLNIDTYVTRIIDLISSYIVFLKF